MENEDKEKEVLVLLDFNAKIPCELLQNKIFLRIENIHKEHPLIQVNDMVFKGTYDHSMGTNLFFKEVRETLRNTFPFQKPSSLLKFIGTQTKVINCKQMRVPPRTAIIPKNNENIQFNFDFDYDELLKKFEDGTLELKDMIKCETSESCEQTIISEDSDVKELEASTNIEPEVVDFPDSHKNVATTPELPKTEVQDDSMLYQEMLNNYENLLLLSRRPVKRERTLEIVADCDPNYQSSYEYKGIECKVLEPPDFLYFQTKNIHDGSRETNCDYATLDRCIRPGFLTPLKEFSTLNEDDKRKLLAIENFENLNLEARYFVLKLHIDELEKQINSSTAEENFKKCEFGHTPVETLDIFRKLTVALQRRIQEISMSHCDGIKNTDVESSMILE